MIYIFLTVLCSTSIALIIKHSSVRMENPIVLLAANYLIAGSAAAIMFIAGDMTFSAGSLMLGWGVGLLFLVSFFVFAKAIAAAGTALATVSSRISVIIPVMLSIIIYNEVPGVYQSVGITAAVLTIVLFYFSLRNLGKGHLRLNDFLILFSVLIGIGAGDFCMKIFQQWRPASEKPFFLMNVFGSAFVYAALYIIVKKIKVERKPVIRGFVLGIPNVFSSFFLISALTAVPAIIVYPAVNIGVIILTTVAAYILWKEQLNIYGKLAILSGIISIILLGAS